jgi:hypothetical protein
MPLFLRNKERDYYRQHILSKKCAKCNRLFQGGCSKNEVSAILETRGYSSVGRAPALQAGCRRFEPVYPH